jgi:hypothetical protein
MVDVLAELEGTENDDVEDGVEKESLPLLMLNMDVDVFITKGGLFFRLIGACLCLDVLKEKRRRGKRYVGV